MMIPDRRSELTQANYVQRVALAFLILLAVTNISTLLTERVLDWEEYRILEGIDTPLGEHLSSNLGYGLYHKLSHWVTYRIFDHSMIGLRFFSILTAIASVVLVVFFSRKIFDDDSSVVFVLFVFSTGWFFLDYARWGIAGYSAATLFYILTFYIFWKLSETKIGVGDKILLAVLGGVGIFVLFHTLLAAAIGPATVIGCHLLRTPTDRSNLVRKLKGLAYFSSYPIVAGALYTPLILLPRLKAKGYVHGSDDYKPYLYFANNDDYDRSLIGAFQFYREKTYDLIYWVLHPIGESGAVIATYCVPLLLMGLILSFMPRRIRSPRFFVAMYVITAISGLIVLNLLRAYPIGNPRYGFFLLFPAALIVAYALSDLITIFNWMFRFIPRSLIVGAVSIGLCFLAAYLSVQEANRRLEAGERVTQALGMMRAEHDLLLVESRYRVVVPTMAPSVREKMILLRPASKESPGDTSAPEIMSALGDPAYERILTVSRRPRFNGHDDITQRLAQYYVATSSVDLHPDRSYEVVFHKYNMHLRTWRLREAVMTSTLRDLPTKFGNNNPQLTEDGNLKLRGWILSPQTIDRLEASIGGETFQDVRYPLPRPDVSGSNPAYLIELPGFEVYTPFRTEYEGQEIVLKFFSRDVLVYSRSIKGIQRQ